MEEARVALFGVLHGLRYGLCDRVEQGFIFCLHHNADQQLGAGFANEQAPFAQQRGFRILDSRLHRSDLQGCTTCRKPDIFQHLWAGCEDVGKFAGPLACFNYSGQEL